MAEGWVLPRPVFHYPPCQALPLPLPLPPREPLYTRAWLTVDWPPWLLCVPLLRHSPACHHSRAPRFHRQKAPPHCSHPCSDHGPVLVGSQIPEVPSIDLKLLRRP